MDRRLHVQGMARTLDEFQRWHVAPGHVSEKSERCATDSGERFVRPLDFAPEYLRLLLYSLQSEWLRISLCGGMVKHGIVMGTTPRQSKVHLPIECYSEHLLVLVGLPKEKTQENAAVPTSTRFVPCSCFAAVVADGCQSHATRTSGACLNATFIAVGTPAGCWGFAETRGLSS